MAVVNARPFRPYRTAPPFDTNDYKDYKDSFEIWEAQWDIFLELSTINTTLDASDQPRYKANILKSCMSKSTLTALLSDYDRRKLLEQGPTFKLDDALKTLRLTEATTKCKFERR